MKLRVLFFTNEKMRVFKRNHTRYEAEGIPREVSAGGAHRDDGLRVVAHAHVPAELVQRGARVRPRGARPVQVTQRLCAEPGLDVLWSVRCFRG